MRFVGRIALIKALKGWVELNPWKGLGASSRFKGWGSRSRAARGGALGNAALGMRLEVCGFRYAALVLRAFRVYKGGLRVHKVGCKGI